jgi:hypothetical protein
MNTNVYTIPDYNTNVAFATTQQQPSGIQIIPINQVNKNITPFVVASPSFAVGTTLSEVFSITLTNVVAIHSLSVIADGSALTNGVSFYLQFGQYSIGSATNLVGIIIPYTFYFDYAHYPILQQGSNITLYAIANATGSYIQLIVNGEVL